MATVIPRPPAAPRDDPPRSTPQVGRSMARVDAAEKLRGDAQFVGDLVVPRMLHGKVLRSPYPHARIVSIDTSAADAMPGVVATLTAADLRGHRSVLRPLHPRPADPGDRSGPVRRGADRRRRRGGDRPSPRPRWKRSSSSTRSCRVVATLEEALAPDAPLVHDGPHPARRVPRPGHAAAERDGNVGYRYALERGDLDAVFADRGHRGRGRLHLPGRLPVRDGDAQRRRPGGQRRDHACGRRVSTRSSCAPRSPRCSTSRSAGCAIIVPVPGRRLRQQVVHEDGTDHGRPRAQGRTTGPDRQPRRRIDGHDPPPQHDGADPHGRDERRPPAGARGPRTGSTPAPMPTTDRA